MALGRKKVLGLLGAVAAVVLIASRLLRGAPARGGASTGDSTLRPAAVAVAKRAPLANTLSLSGEFKPFQEVDLHAKVAGYIRHISVDVGDRVQVGQVVAVLEVPELEAEVQGAAASLERAKSAHAAAHFAYLRLKQASEARPGLIAPQELDDAFARDKELEAQVEVSEANQKQQTALSDYTRITAPFTGVITQRYADTGALIQAGTSSNTQAMPVVRLAEDDRLRLVLPVPESAVPQIHLGTAVRVRVQALDRTFEGRVARFSSDLDRQTRTMETEIDVANPDGRLVAGMYAETVLDLGRKESALTIPVEAVSRKGSESTVLVVGSNDRLEERRIELGMEGTTRVEALTGLREGDRVVIGNRSEFRVGEQVQPRVIETAPSDGGANP
ncbi:MAG TPA: efflux RND transporter periplasmic adaptor subunit [Thermoanaerobaculia bacterium]|nr:efflux RND transporter periplasmic adaptor subunit [Thermoanaerobaculia bacterium]